VLQSRNCDIEKGKSGVSYRVRVLGIQHGGLAAQNEVVSLRTQGDGNATAKQDKREHVAILEQASGLAVREKV